MSVVLVLNSRVAQDTIETSTFPLSKMVKTKAFAVRLTFAGVSVQVVWLTKPASLWTMRFWRWMVKTLKIWTSSKFERFSKNEIYVEVFNCSFERTKVVALLGLVLVQLICSLTKMCSMITLKRSLRGHQRNTVERRRLRNRHRCLIPIRRRLLPPQLPPAFVSQVHRLHPHLAINLLFTPFYLSLQPRRHRRHHSCNLRIHRHRRTISPLIKRRLLHYLPHLPWVYSHPNHFVRVHQLTLKRPTVLTQWVMLFPDWLFSSSEKKTAADCSSTRCMHVMLRREKELLLSLSILICLPEELEQRLHGYCFVLFRISLIRRRSKPFERCLIHRTASAKAWTMR